jgi:hypothetical protein
MKGLVRGSSFTRTEMSKSSYNDSMVASCFLAFGTEFSGRVDGASDKLPLLLTPGLVSSDHPYYPFFTLTSTWTVVHPWLGYAAGTRLRVGG